MKTALILFRHAESIFDSQYVGEITDCLQRGGFPASTVEILSVDDDLGFKHALDRFKDTVDNLIIVYHEDLQFDAKEIIGKQMDTVLLENDNAVKFIEALSKAHGKQYELTNALMPIEATLIPNLTGAFQGFIMESEEFSLVVLPWQIDQFKIACDKYLLPYFDKKFNEFSSRITLKYFGDGDKLSKQIEKAKQTTLAQATVSFYEKYGDYTVTIIGKEQRDTRAIAKELIINLQDSIYAETDVSLSERLFDLLRLKKLKIATAESFTAGRIVASIISNSGASQHVHEGVVCYSNDSKESRMNIDKGDLMREGAVSSMTAYRMATGLLKQGKVDVAISTTGVAGPFGDGSQAPVGLCYVGIGMMDGVHTYKLNFTGSREEITEKAKNTALFLTIKKLKSLK